MLSNKTLFLIILLFSGIISSLLFFGPIDKDYFSFYYIGKGVLNGLNMYKDFADNKGPLLYSFFVLLNLIFGSSYKLALFFGSTLLDSFSVYFLFRILRQFYGIILRTKFLSIFVIFLAVALYKHFFISPFGGGIYSESLGMVFLTSAYFSYRNNKNFTAGLLFASSVFSRLSFLFFIFVFFIPLNRKNAFVNIASFIKGFLAVSLVISLPFILTGTIKDLFYNTAIYNVYYGQAVQSIKTVYFIAVLLSDKVIFLALLVTFSAVLTYLLKAKSKEKYSLLALLICSAIAINPGGIFYVHHFSQFMLVTFIAFAILAKRLPVLFCGVIFISISIALYMYLTYSITPSDHKTTPNFKSIANKQYLEVMPYDPEYYFAYDKTAPDKYYQGFFILNYYNAKSFSEDKKHAELTPEKLRKTAFMMVIHNAFDRAMIDEYLRKFGEKFQLSKAESYRDKNIIIDVYISKL